MMWSHSCSNALDAVMPERNAVCRQGVGDKQTQLHRDSHGREEIERVRETLRTSQPGSRDTLSLLSSCVA